MVRTLQQLQLPPLAARASTEPDRMDFELHAMWSKPEHRRSHVNPRRRRSDSVMPFSGHWTIYLFTHFLFDLFYKVVTRNLFHAAHRLTVLSNGILSN